MSEPQTAAPRRRRRARARSSAKQRLAEIFAQPIDGLAARLHLEDPWPWTPSTGAVLGGSRRPLWAAASVEASLVAIARRETAFDSVRELNRLADPGPRPPPR